MNIIVLTEKKKKRTTCINKKQTIEEQNKIKYWVT